MSARRWSVVLRTVLCTLAAASGARPATAKEPDGVRPDGGKDFVLESVHETKLAATWWYDATPRGPGAVLLFTDAEDRAAWSSVVRHLRARGMNVVGVDLPNCTGASAPTNAHEHAMRAVEHLTVAAKCDPKRIGIAGAGTAAAVAIDSARRNPGDVAAVVGVGPVPGAADGSVPPGLKFPDATALLLMCHTEDCDAATRAIHLRIGGSRLLVLDDVRPKGVSAGWVRGSRLLAHAPLADRTVASFLDARSGSKRDDVVLDGIVDDEAAPDGPWPRATPVGRGKDRVWAYRVGKRLVFGGFAPKGTRAVRLDVAGLTAQAAREPAPKESEWFRRDVFDLRAFKLAWRASIPPMSAAFLAKETPPAIRAVPCGDGLSFEGEWALAATAFSDDGVVADAIRVLVTCEPGMPPEQKGDPSGNLAHMASVPSR